MHQQHEPGEQAPPRLPVSASTAIRRWNRRVDLNVRCADAVHDLDREAMGVERAARGEDDGRCRPRRQAAAPAPATATAAAAASAARGPRLSRWAMTRAAGDTAVTRAAGPPHVEAAGASKVTRPGTGRSAEAPPGRATARASCAFRRLARLQPRGTRASTGPRRATPLRSPCRPEPGRNSAKPFPARPARRRVGEGQARCCDDQHRETHDSDQPRRRAAQAAVRRAAGARDRRRIASRSIRPASRGRRVAKRAGRIDHRPVFEATSCAPAVALISPTSWVAMTTVVPRRLRAVNRCMSRFAISASTLPVGSSATSSSGRLMTARAMATRCCSPPESVAGRALARSREADPGEHFAHRPFDLALAGAGDAQRQCDIVERRQMADQPEILEDDADAPPESGSASRDASVISSPNRRMRPRVGRWAR